MKRISLLLSVIVMLFVTSCSDTRSVKSTPEVNITTTDVSLGLDFKLVGALLQDGKISDADGLEKELNRDGGINNLDLNGDGSVDYINVSENDGQETIKGFDLTTGSEEDPTFIGSIEVEKTGDTYNINMSGSEAIYGNNNHYQSQMSGSNMLFYAWLFSPRPYYYHRPYYMGHYPGYYGSSRVIVSRSAYTSRTTTQRTTTSKSVTKSKTPHKSKVKSKNKGKISKKARTTISDNKKSQKSFNKRNSNKKTGKGGFSSKAKGSKSKGTKFSKSRVSKSKKKSSSWGRSSRSSSSRSSSRRSDINSKESIQNFGLGLVFMNQLQPKTYFYKKSWITKEGLPTTKQYGLIAQDVEKIIPSMVHTDTNGFKSVDYLTLVPILVQANKELIRNMRMMEKRIDDLEKLSASK